MARALIDESKPEWVTERDLLGPEGDAEAKYLIKPIGVDRYREFEKRCTSMQVNKHSRAREPKVDHIALSDLVFDHALIGWEGIIGSNGKPIACADLATKKGLPGIVIGAITEYASQGGAGKTADERAESFRATPDVG